jgi:hypothetical protein
VENKLKNTKVKKVNVTYRIVKVGSKRPFTSDVYIKNVALVRKISDRSITIKALSSDNQVIGEPIEIEFDGEILEVDGVEI